MYRLTITTILICVVMVAAVRAQESAVADGGRSGWQALTPAQRTAVFDFADDYKSYLTVAKSAFTSTREAVRRALAAGFSHYREPSQVQPGARLLFRGRDRALILVVVGNEPLTNCSRVVGTHHDSPHIDLKARPVYSAGGFAMLKTIYYGGIKKYQWANEPLALIGHIDTTDGRRVDVSIGMRPGDPVFVIPDSAPHSDTELRTRNYTNVLTGEELNPVVGSIPGEHSSVASEFINRLITSYNIKEEDLVSAELELVPAVQPADVGLDRGLVGAYGQDDRLSSFCAVRSIIDLKGTPQCTAMAYLSNFEEVGSVNNTGAASEFLNFTFAQLIAAQRGANYRELDLRLALSNAQVVSADTNDGINPLFPQTNEPLNAARLGYGVTIKRYGRGFDANSEFIARIRAILERDSIPWQTHAPKVDVGGGGTIGRFMSGQNMEVIDLGVPLLSMHATFEVSSKVDTWNFYRFMLSFFQSINKPLLSP